MAPETDRGRAAGFTVLEMAIALAIAGVALVVLLQLLSTSMVTTGRADRLAEATMLARSKLAETVGVEPVHLGATTGKGPHDLTWRAEIAPAEEDPLDDSRRRLVAVVVSVFPPAPQAREPIVRFQSYAFAVVE